MTAAGTRKGWVPLCLINYLIVFGKFGYFCQRWKAVRLVVVMRIVLKFKIKRWVISSFLITLRTKHAPPWEMLWDKQLPYLKPAWPNISPSLLIVCWSSPDITRKFLKWYSGKSLKLTGRSAFSLKMTGGTWFYPDNHANYSIREHSAVSRAFSCSWWHHLPPSIPSYGLTILLRTLMVF